MPERNIDARGEQLMIEYHDWLEELDLSDVIEKEGDELL
jgi:hypothetical protein